MLSIILTWTKLQYLKRKGESHRWKNQRFFLYLVFNSLKNDRSLSRLDISMFSISSNSCISLIPKTTHKGAPCSAAPMVLEPPPRACVALPLLFPGEIDGLVCVKPCIGIGDTLAVAAVSGV